MVDQEVRDTTRFAKAAFEAADFHLPLKAVLGGRKPEDIWCREATRQPSNDGVVTYGNRKLQVAVRPDMPQKSKVLVRTTEDGSVRIIYRAFNNGEEREHELRWQEFIQQKKERAALEPKSQGSPSNAASRPHHSSRPSPRHPWIARNQYDVAVALKARAELEMHTTPELR